MAKGLVRAASKPSLSCPITGSGTGLVTLHPMSVRNSRAEIFVRKPERVAGFLPAAVGGSWLSRSTRLSSLASSVSP